MEAAIAEELAGMPEPWHLKRTEAGDQVFVFRGPHLFASYEKCDLSMRNLAIVGATRSPGRGPAPIVYRLAA